MACTCDLASDTPDRFAYAAVLTCCIWNITVHKIAWWAGAAAAAAATVGREGQTQQHSSNGSNSNHSNNAAVAAAMQQEQQASSSRGAASCQVGRGQSYRLQDKLKKHLIKLKKEESFSGSEEYIQIFYPT